MKAIFSFIISLSFALVNQSYSQSYNFASNMQLSGATIGTQILVDSDGNTIVCGGFGNGYDNNGPNQGAFLAKYSPSGQQMWIDTVWGRVGFMAITLDEDNNIYLAGQYRRTIHFHGRVLDNLSDGNKGLIAKYNPQGVVQWNRHTEGIASNIKIAYANATLYCVVALYDTCSFETNYTFPGKAGINIITFDTGGNYLDQDIIMTQPNKVLSITLDKNGFLGIFGTFANPITFDTITLNPISGYPSHHYFAKYDGSLNCVWAKPMECALGSSYVGTEATIDENGNIYISGLGKGIAWEGIQYNGPNTGTQEDAIVLKANADGSFGWVKFFGNGNWEKGYGITNDEQGSIFLTGIYNGSTQFGNYSLNCGSRNLYVMKLDVNGDIKWISEPTLGSNSSSDVYAIASDKKGGVYVGGFFVGTISFGNTTLTATGSKDMYIAKLTDAGFTSLNEINKGQSSINVYPNPSTGSFNVALNKISLPANIKVHNLLGELILQKQVTGEVITIELTTKGTYFIELGSGEATEVKKLVVQ